jgi:hypothetical protein
MRLMSIQVARALRSRPELRHHRSSRRFAEPVAVIVVTERESVKELLDEVSARE